MYEMKLNRLTERIWIYPFEEERDRPNLGYIRGDRWSIAVDAGHSSAHTEEFYGSLEEAGLPLPALTVLTHWHWDHTFGMHAVNGLCLANTRTGSLLQSIRDRILREGRESFLSLDVKIAKEYAGNRPIIVTMPDMLFSGEMLLDPGGCPIRIFQAESPHTDDSTLIYVPGEKVLFMGDAACGVFPTWKSDLALCTRLANTVIPLDFDICVESHCAPLSKDEEIAGLLERNAE